MSTDSIPVLCRYRVKSGQAEAFEALLRSHWKNMFDLGFVTDQPADLQRASDQAGNVAYIESFAWKSPSAIGAAHESPDVMRLWEPMGALCEDMEFWHVEQIKA